MADPEVLKLPKKMVILCDGTWENSDVGYEKGGLFGSGHPQVPTNVTRLSRSIVPEDSRQHPQIVYYQAGVGSGWSITDQLLGGGLAFGISENVREAYAFLAANYMVTDDLDADGDFIGDQIFLIGFSRGAFTARSVGGLLCSVGLLTKEAMQYFYYVFDDYQGAGSKKYVPKITTALPDFKISVPPIKTDEYLAAYKKELLRLKLTTEVKIQAIGVFDTVGTLGLPTVPLLQKLGLPTTIHSYRFTDTGISKRVLNAFQALALDERRSTFQATLWEKKPDNTITNLKQVWFPGVHCNVGGGYADTSIADLTLAWMIDHLSPMIEFNTKYLPTQVQANIALNYLPPPTAASSATTSKATAASKSLKPWRYGLGTVYDSDTFPYSLAGSSQRTPGTYHELNYTTGKPTKVMLRQTNEFVHASVRARIKFGGTDANGKQYDPEGLEDWELVQGTEAMGSPSGTGMGALWMYRGSDAGAKGRVLEEDTLGKTELMVLDLDPEMKQNLFG